MVLSSSPEARALKQPLHAILYCRATVRSGRWMERQEERCRRKAVEEGAETTIYDRGGSGLGRPGITELRTLLQSGRADLVVADAPDRLSVRLADIRALAREVSRAGARLMFVSP